MMHTISHISTDTGTQQAAHERFINAVTNFEIPILFCRFVVVTN